MALHTILYATLLLDGQINVRLALAVAIGPKDLESVSRIQAYSHMYTYFQYDFFYLLYMIF